MKQLIFIVCCLFALGSYGQQVLEKLSNGELWPDDAGQHINAHGGGVMKYGDTYYWFGEHKSEHTSNALIGVTCYASEDLVNWRNCGVALSSEL